MAPERGEAGLVKDVDDDEPAAGESAEPPKLQAEDCVAYVSLNEAGFGSEDMVLPLVSDEAARSGGNLEATLVY